MVDFSDNHSHWSLFVTKWIRHQKKKVTKLVQFCWYLSADLHTISIRWNCCYPSKVWRD